MKRDLLELICCPACEGRLTVDAAEIRDGKVWQGTLTCTGCAASYDVLKGMPYLYSRDERWSPKEREAEGWITIHKELGIYDASADSVDLQIPYYPEEPWINVARSFDMGLSFLDLDGSETVLDLGAGRGWAAKELALLGCRVVAIDIVPDDNVGLGRGKALMEHAGVYFERVIGDGENLPFQPDSFDIVFCAAVLHHSSHLDLLLQHIHNVLEPGGRLCAINEPCIAVYANEQKVLSDTAAHELKVGINETRPNIIAYHRALERANLEVVEAFPAPSHGMTGEQRLEWARDLGAVRPPLSPTQPKRFVTRLGLYMLWRLRALANGSFSRARRFLAAGNGNDLDTAVLLWNGGELFLLAEKAEDKGR